MHQQQASIHHLHFPVHLFRLILKYEGQHIDLHSTGTDYDEFRETFTGDF